MADLPIEPEGWIDPAAIDREVRALEVIDEHYAMADTVLRTFAAKEARLRELRAKRAVEKSLPRGLRWLADHPRLLAWAYRLRLAKRPTVRVFSMSTASSYEPHA